MSHDLYPMPNTGDGDSRSFRLVLHELLRRPGVAGIPKQAACGADACSHCLSAGQAATRRNPRVRQAEVGETPLSYDEIAFGVQRGLI